MGVPPCSLLFRPDRRDDCNQRLLILTISSDCRGHLFTSRNLLLATLVRRRTTRLDARVGYDTLSARLRYLLSCSVAGAEEATDAGSLQYLPINPSDDTASALSILEAGRHLLRSDLASVNDSSPWSSVAGAEEATDAGSLQCTTLHTPMANAE
nr:hypothetical protein CFP56_75565 [Quercus suber]